MSAANETNESVILPSLQAIYEEVQRVVLAEVGDGYMVRRIYQTSNTEYLAAQHTLIDPINMVQTHLSASFHVICTKFFLQEKEIRLAMMSDGELRIVEVSEKRRYGV